MIRGRGMRFGVTLEIDVAIEISAIEPKGCGFPRLAWTTSLAQRISGSASVGPSVADVAMLVR